MPKSSIDAKGRMNFPSKVREELGESFMVTKTLRKEKSLTVYSMQEWEAFTAKLKALPTIETQDMQSFFLGEKQKLTPDKQGRVVISAELREYAEIESETEVMVCGLDGKAEVWSFANWTKKMSTENIEGLINTAIQLGL